MAGIGEAASVIAVIQISQQVLSLCWKYYSGAKGARTDMGRLCDEVTALSRVLERVQELMLDGPKAARLPASSALVGQIEQCSLELKDLINRLDPGQGRKAMNRLGLRALKWPFTVEDVDKK